MFFILERRLSDKGQEHNMTLKIENANNYKLYKKVNFFSL